jgi:signal transduction histidine kinase
VNDVLQRTFRLLAPDVPAGIQVDLDLAPELPRVACDPEQLKQVFLNLALNAFQAMPGGGRLQVSTRADREDLAPWRDARGRLASVEVRFRDTGPGIPPQDRENVFVPFFTTKEKGTGLGLAVSQRIVRAHDGTLAVSSPAGGGAEFTITLPALAEEAPAAAAAEPSPPARRRRRRRA